MAVVFALPADVDFWRESCCPRDSEEEVDTEADGIDPEVDGEGVSSFTT